MNPPTIAVVFHSVCANTYLMAKEYREALAALGAQVLFYRLPDPNYAVTADAEVSVAQAPHQFRLFLPGNPFCKSIDINIVITAPVHFREFHDNRPAFP